MVACKSGTDRADGTDGDTLIDDGNPVPIAHGITGSHEFARIVFDFGADLFFKDGKVLAGAIE